MDWDALRADEFPVARRWAFFDHASVSPLPRRAGDALRAWAADVEENGNVGWLAQDRRLAEVRGQVARLIHADADEVAFVGNTTLGIGLIAEGFPWRDGDNVVSAADEYPSNVYPWMNLSGRGVALRAVPGRDGRIALDDLAAAIDGRTRMLAISHVEFASGFRNDLEALSALCRDRGVALFVDVVQGLGPLTLDVTRTPIDFLAGNGQKWLLGPEGTGYLYVRREWLDRLRVLGVGSGSVVGSFNDPTPVLALKPDARRWEGGARNTVGLHGLGASLDLLLEIGPDAVSARILDRAEAVRELAASAGWSVYGPTRPEERSGIVCLECPGVDPDAFARRMRERGVVLSSRRGRVRASPHIYNDADDLGRLADGLRSARAER